MNPLSILGSILGQLGHAGSSALGHIGNSLKTAAFDPSIVADPNATYGPNDPRRYKQFLDAMIAGGQTIDAHPGLDALPSWPPQDTARNEFDLYLGTPYDKISARYPQVTSRSNHTNPAWYTLAGGFVGNYVPGQVPSGYQNTPGGVFRNDLIPMSGAGASGNFNPQTTSRLAQIQPQSMSSLQGGM